MTERDRRVTWRRLARATAAIRSLARGHCKVVDELKRDYPPSTWSSATPTQRTIINELWSKLVQRADWGSISDGRAVLGRLGAGRMMDYGGVGQTARTTGRLKKGDLCDLLAEQVSVPRRGVRGLPISKLSAAATPYLENVAGLMLKTDDEIDWDKYHGMKSYCDPGWRNKKNRLELSLRMWEGGMLSYVDHIEERVGVFTVVKNLSQDDEGRVESSRLVWDCRRLTLRFRRPPWTGLG